MKLKLNISSPVKRLHGGSLIYTLMISLIIAALMGAYIMVNFYQSQLLNKQYYEQLAYSNLESGLNLFLNRHQIGESMAMQLFESHADSFYIQSENWGLMGLVHIKGKHKKAKASRSVFVGQVPQGPFSASLYLADQGQPLVLSGNTYLGGRLLLPKFGLKTGYVNRQGFLRKKLHEGVVQNSQEELPAINSLQVKAIQDSLKRLAYFSSLPDNYALRNLNHFQPWDSTAFVLKSSSSLVLEDMSLQGKCLIASAHKLIITPSAKLDNTLLLAREITIQHGFSGRIQAFALDSLIVEDRVELEYPSVLFLQNSDKNKPMYLHVGDNSKIAGSIIFDRLDRQNQSHRNDYCFIGKSLIYGHIYASHALDLRADVRGSVICGDFLLQTPATRYRDYLMDAELDFRKLSDAYLMPVLTGGGELGILDWLEEGGAGL